ncbi:MAG: 2-amino-4-hydroxy-6-hydroxymethyldihydropteridine diphosphokinase [Halobacteriovorax sp.]|nr:2-amino-4-hydroxy-6-hydroxymethyldihydropteridine diphosphokinase [Halobacteriovorax sp.]|tara:strand:+ start:284685 stop:285152 length:468 start_codon:yes stop_codon:yes gene_type:complete
MALIISLGSNIGNRLENLKQAKKFLSEKLELKSQSRVYRSPAVDYLDQPEFLNQVLQFKIPNISPQECLQILLSIEVKMGRIRKISKGPRVIDIDLLFWSIDTIDSPNLEVPHPRLFQRSFIVLPLKELPIFETLSSKFDFPSQFCNEAFPLDNV